MTSLLEQSPDLSMIITCHLRHVVVENGSLKGLGCDAESQRFGRDRQAGVVVTLIRKEHI